uniref:Os08g0511700 protein n=1 Tax=Macrostomum lignano TaxID=282301 RepID=A0A1I8FRQ5_9PLAT
AAAAAASPADAAIGTRPSFQATLWRGGARSLARTGGGASRSVELPDAVVSGVGVAFVVGGRPWAVGCRLRQERSCISGIRDRGQRRTAGVGFELRPWQQQQQTTAVRTEKFCFTDPAVSASAPSLFLQRLVELSALQAETVRHEKMKANKRKLRS